MHNHPLVEEVNDLSSLRAIIKHRSHLGLLTVLDEYKNSSIFTFSHVTKEVVVKEIANLNTTKSPQDTYFGKNYLSRF